MPPRFMLPRTLLRRPRNSRQGYMPGACYIDKAREVRIFVEFCEDVDADPRQHLVSSASHNFSSRGAPTWTRRETSAGAGGPRTSTTSIAKSLASRQSA